MYIKKYPLFKLHAFQLLIKKNKYFIRKTISVIVVKCMYGNVIPVIIHGVPLEIVVHLFISFLKEKNHKRNIFLRISVGYLIGTNNNNYSRGMILCKLYLRGTSFHSLFNIYSIYQ
jgi:hypothetical protein